MSLKVKRIIKNLIIFSTTFYVGMGILRYIFRSLAYGKLLKPHHTYITHWMKNAWFSWKSRFYLMANNFKPTKHYPEGFRPIYDDIFDYIVLFSPLIILAIYAFYKRKPITAYIKKKYKLWKSRTKNERIKRLENEIEELKQKER